MLALNSEVKRIARGRLLDKYGVVIGAFLIQMLIVLAVDLVSSSAVDTSFLAGTVLYAAINIIVNLIMVVFAVGELTIYLNIACGNECKATDIFNGLNLHPDKAIILDIVIFFKTYIWALPSLIALVYYFVSSNLWAIIAFGVLGIAGLIKVVYVQCELSQCYYIFLDYPDYSVSDIIAASRNLMKNHIGKYFGLIMSFIPLDLLVLVSLGLANVYLRPYKIMTYTEFYLDLARKSAPGASFEAVADETVYENIPE